MVLSPAQSGKTLAELAAHVGGEVLGDAQRKIVGVNGLAEAQADQLSFFASAKYKKALQATRAGAVLVGRDAPAAPPGTVLVRVANPHLAFAKISTVFHPRPSFAPGVHPRAHVHPEAVVHPSATVMAGATVERGAQVGERSVLCPGVFIGEGAKVGAECFLDANAVVREGCSVGDRVILHAGAVIGADGFGFAFDPERMEHYKIPQAGTVRIEDDVEIGANSCVDRGTIGDTVVGKGTKVDNLVQIAHNVKIGPLSLLCAQVGIAGSTEIGPGCVFGGQAGVINHLSVGAQVKAGARALILSDVEDGEVVNGAPAIRQSEWLRNATAFRQLASLVSEVRKLKAKVEALEQEKAR